MGQTKDKLMTAGLYLELYVGVIIIFLAAIMMGDPGDQEMMLYLLINAIVAIIAAVCSLKKKWQMQPVALILSAIFVIWYYFDSGISFEFMGHLDFLVGAICSLLGMERDSYGGSYSEGSSSSKGKVKIDPAWFDKQDDGWDGGNPPDNTGGFR